MSKELLPCPFCGGEVEMLNYSPKEWLVSCKQCSGMVEKWRETKEEAIEQWNTRKPIDRIMEQLEEEKDIAYADFEKYTNDYFLDLDEDADDWYYKGLERAINIIRKGGVE